MLYYLKTNIVCNKLTIYNPKLGYDNYILIDEFIIKEFLSIVTNYNIGQKCFDNYLNTNKTNNIINI